VHQASLSDWAGRGQSGGAVWLAERGEAELRLEARARAALKDESWEVERGEEGRFL